MCLHLDLRHKDDNAHYNARKMRHHRPIQLEVFYCTCITVPALLAVTILVLHATGVTALNPRR